MEEGSYECDLKIDLLATQRGSAGQGRDLVEGARELSNRFEQRRTPQRSLSGFAPPFNRVLGEAGLGEVMRQQFGLDGSAGVDAQNFGDPAMQNVAAAFQQILISTASWMRACLNR